MLSYYTYLGILHAGGYIIDTDYRYDATINKMYFDDGYFMSECIDGEEWTIGMKIPLTIDYIKSVYHYLRLLPEQFSLFDEQSNPIEVRQEDYTYQDYMSGKCNLYLYKKCDSVLSGMPVMVIRNNHGVNEFAHHNIAYNISTNWQELGIQALFPHIRDYGPENCYYGNHGCSVRFVESNGGTNII